MKRNYRSFLKIVCFTLIALSLIGLTGCGKKEETKLAMGESYTTDQWKITLNSCDVTRKITSSVGRLPAKQDKVYVLVNISFDNISEERGLVGFENFAIQVRGSNNIDTAYGMSDGAFEILDDFFPYGYVEAQKTMTGMFPFEIPDTTKDLTLAIYLDGQIYLWDLIQGAVI